jgi:single-stranded-DNA-specific exonuclease
MNKQKSRFVKKLNRLLPLVAIGTIADCQSVLEPTNRLLVKAGIKVIREKTHSIDGLSELLIKTGLQAKMETGYMVTSQDLAYILSPILNSSGRMSHASLSIALLLSRYNSDKGIPFSGKIKIADNPEELASKLIETNNARKEDVKKVIIDINNQVSTMIDSGKKMIWVERSDLSKGIIGLIASQLVNKYNLPTIIISKNKQILTEEEKEYISKIFMKSRLKQSSE